MRTYLASSKRSRGIESRDMKHDILKSIESRDMKHDILKIQVSECCMGVKTFFLVNTEKKKVNTGECKLSLGEGMAHRKFFGEQTTECLCRPDKIGTPQNNTLVLKYTGIFLPKIEVQIWLKKMPTWLVLGFLPVFWGHQQALAASRLHLPWTGPASTFFRLAGGTPPRSTCPWGNPCFWTVDWGVARSSERYFSPLPLLSYADSHQPQ